MPDTSKIQMVKVDSLTGQEIPTTDEQKQHALDALREAFRNGQVRYSPQAIKDMGIHGLTREVVESWMAEKH